MPAAAEAPPKAGTVSSEPTQTETTPLSDSMAELVELSGEEPQAPPEPPKKATPAPKKTDQPQKEDEELDELAGTKKTEQPPKKDEPVTEEPQKPVKAAELRVAYEKTKETLKSREAEVAKLRADLKAAQEAPREDPEKSTLLGKLQEFEKRSKSLEEKLRLVDYQQSEEFVKNYQKPWQDAWQRAASEIQELTVELEDGTTRPATIEDLNSFAMMKLAEARKLAKKVFGEDADEVMAHLRKLRELSEAQQNALKEAQTKSEAHFKQQQEQGLQERQKVAKLWKDENDAWRTKFPKWFQPAEGDEEANALLTKGYALADRAFSNNGQTTPEERVKLHAELRNKAAAFPRLALELKRARGRIKELEKAVADYESSEPPAGEGGKVRASKPTDMIDDAFSELDTLDKK